MKNFEFLFLETNEKTEVGASSLTEAIKIFYRMNAEPLENFCGYLDFSSFLENIENLVTVRETTRNGDILL